MPADPAVAAYVSTLSAEARDRLEELRRILYEAAPDAMEVISYKALAFKYHRK